MTAAARSPSPNSQGQPLQFKADVTPLLKAVGYAQNGAMDRTSIPILSNILLHVMDGKVLLVCADMDREVEVEIEAVTSGVGSTTAPHHTLDGLLRGYPAGGEAVIKLTDNGRLSVACGRSAAHLPTLESDQYPRISLGGHDRVAFDLDTDVLERMIDKVGFACTDLDVKPFMIGLRLHTTPDGKIRAVGTDGAWLAMMEAEAPEGLDLAKGVTIHPKTASALRKLTPAGGEMTTIQVSPNLIEFSLRQVRMTSKVIGHEYCNYPVFFSREFGSPVLVDKGDLMAILNRSILFSTSTNRRIKIEVQPGKITAMARTMSTGALDDEIAAEYAGEPFSIVFNAKRLLDIVQHIDESRVELCFTAPDFAFRVRGEGSQSLQYVLMPLPDGLLEAAGEK